MSDLEKIEKTDRQQDDHDRVAEADDEASKELPPVQPGLRERVWKLFKTVQQPGPGTKHEMAKDRTRSLTLIIGGIVVVVLLFIGVVSTPTTPPAQQASGRAAPNLGRAVEPNPSTASPSSVTPLLNADIQSDEGDSDQLSPADIQATSPRAFADETRSLPETRLETHVVPPPSIPAARDFDETGPTLAAGSDPLAEYRLNDSTGTPTYRYGGPLPSTVGAELPRPFTDDARGAKPAENRIDSPAAGKSSMVFVRSAESPEPGATRSEVNTSFSQVSLLPPGTRLIARLEAAATSAVKTPVVASIEYHYERDGVILVPAGTQVIGDVQQATSEGYVTVRFHTMRMPDGREEAIEGTGLSLDHKPLKGEVSGKNTGKRLLSRTLSGIGTIAAYVVGAGGAGLSRSVTGETLLRDRVAGNIALAGEQELMNAAYSQNVSVTVPANTRFYVVLQKAAVNTMTPAPSRVAESTAPSGEIPTVQELRELMELRREINRMYLESNSTFTAAGP